MTEKPLILVCNDDGIEAPGILALARGLGEVGEVVVVAPDREQSAMSHALTLHRPLRAEEVEPGWWAVSGTPADCVYLAIHHLLPRAPSLVVSGINAGYNLGSDFFYSGTVAAAVEAAVRGVPAFAISMERTSIAMRDAGLAEAARFAGILARAILTEGLPPNTLLNVNVPSHGALLGARWTRLGQRIYGDRVEARTDPRGQHYFWIGGAELDVAGAPDSDGIAVRDRFVSITPLDLDLTSHRLLESLPGWRLPGFESILADGMTPAKEPG